MSDSIVINGKQMSKEEAVQYINKATTCITHINISFDNEENPESTAKEEGVEISKDLTLSLYKSMKESNAKYARLTAENCKNLGNVDLIITLRDGKESWLERTLRKLDLIS